MAVVRIYINNRPYDMACEEGQEQRLQNLAHFLDQKVASLAQNLGQVGETRLLLMGALMIADELFESRETSGQSPATYPAASTAALDVEQLDLVNQKLKMILQELQNKSGLVPGL